MDTTLLVMLLGGIVAVFVIGYAATRGAKSP